MFIIAGIVVIAGTVWSKLILVKTATTSGGLSRTNYKDDWLIQELIIELVLAPKNKKKVQLVPFCDSIFEWDFVNFFQDYGVDVKYPV